LRDTRRALALGRLSTAKALRLRPPRVGGSKISPSHKVPAGIRDLRTALHQLSSLLLSVAPFGPHLLTGLTDEWVACHDSFMMTSQQYVEMSRLKRYWNFRLTTSRIFDYVTFSRA
jgi:hypothetical protein